MNKKRLKPKERRDLILDAAIEVSIGKGYDNTNQHDIANHAGISPSLVIHYFRTMTQLRRAVMREAIKREIPEIVAQGLIKQDQHAKKAGEALKQKAADYLVGL